MAAHDHLSPHQFAKYKPGETDLDWSTSAFHQPGMTKHQDSRHAAEWVWGASHGVATTDKMSYPTAEYDRTEPTIRKGGSVPFMPNRAVWPN